MDAHCQTTAMGNHVSDFLTNFRLMYVRAGGMSQLVQSVRTKCCVCYSPTRATHNKQDKKIQKQMYNPTLKNICFQRSWSCYLKSWNLLLFFFYLFSNVCHLKVERVDRWTPSLFGWPPSLNPPHAVDPVWPRGLYSGTGSLCTRTGLPFISHGRLHRVHNLFIPIIIRHHPAHGLQGFRNICLGCPTRMMAVAGEVYGLYTGQG